MKFALLLLMSVFSFNQFALADNYEKHACPGLEEAEFEYRANKDSFDVGELDIFVLSKSEIKLYDVQYACDELTKNMYCAKASKVVATHLLKAVMLKEDVPTLNIEQEDKDHLMNLAEEEEAIAAESKIKVEQICY